MVLAVVTYLQTRLGFLAGEGGKVRTILGAAVAIAFLLALVFVQYHMGYPVVAYSVAPDRIAEWGVIEGAVKTWSIGLMVSVLAVIGLALIGSVVCLVVVLGRSMFAPSTR